MAKMNNNEMESIAKKLAEYLDERFPKRVGEIIRKQV